MTSYRPPPPLSAGVRHARQVRLRGAGARIGQGEALAADQPASGPVRARPRALRTGSTRRRGGCGWRSACVRTCPRQAPSFEDRLDAEAATEAFLKHEFDRMRSWQRLRESELEEWRDASGLGGSTMWITAEEMRQIHDEIWPDRKSTRLNSSHLC